MFGRPRVGGTDAGPLRALAGGGTCMVFNDEHAPSAKEGGWPWPVLGDARYIAAAPLSDGRLQLWVAAGDGHLYSTYKLSADPESHWAAWEDFGVVLTPSEP